MSKKAILPWEAWVRFCDDHASEECAAIGNDVREELLNRELMYDTDEDENGNEFEVPTCQKCFVAYLIPESEARTLFEMRSRLEVQ